MATSSLVEWGTISKNPTDIANASEAIPSGQSKL